MEDEQQWERLLEEQSALFRRTFQKNAELEARVIELERELNVWKSAFKSTDEEKILLKKRVARLERNIGSLKDDNPLVLCVIDGDGNIFSDDLVSQGRAGGIQAAQLLTKGITDYLAESDDGVSPSSVFGRAQIWVSVFYNKSGLQETLTSLQLCTVEQFEAFIMGFNQASPLFSLMDVGHGKEAADTKIKEYLRVFTRFPQTHKVFFGGGHDNGYASTLNSLNNEGFLDKIILLRGYKEIAFEVNTLRLPSVEFAGVFMTERLPFNHQYRRNNGPSPTENERWTPRNSPNSIMGSPSKPRQKLRQQSELSSVTKYNPPACNFYYLAVCRAGSSCRYGHDYDIDTEELTVMRVYAKKSPCGMLNRNQTCPLGDRCPLGHMCPGGPTCKFYKAGRCKFTGEGMHDAISGNTSPKKQILVRQDSYSAHSSGETRPVTPGLAPIATETDGTELENTGKFPALPYELSPVPGSNAWITKYYSQYNASPVDQDNYLDTPDRSHM